MSALYPTYPQPYGSPMTAHQQVTPENRAGLGVRGTWLAIAAGAAVLLASTTAGLVVNLHSAKAANTRMSNQLDAQHQDMITAQGEAAGAQADAAEARQQIGAATSNSDAAALATGLAQRRANEANAANVLAQQAAEAANQQAAAAAAQANANADVADSNASAAQHYAAVARSEAAQKAQGLTDFQACMTALNDFLEGDDSAATAVDARCNAVVTDLS